MKVMASFWPEMEQFLTRGLADIEARNVSCIRLSPDSKKLDFKAKMRLFLYHKCQKYSDPSPGI